VSLTITKTCAACAQPIDGLPFGPIRAEVCQSCWLADTDRVAQDGTAANEPVGEDDLSDEEAAELETIAGELDDAILRLRTAIDQRDADAIEEAARVIDGLAFEIKVTLP
jgi:hypothetical protein